MRIARAAASSALVLVLSACAGGGGGGDGGRPAEVLADRVAALLAAGDSSDAAGADVTCPSVRDPRPGDRATCVARMDDGHVSEVDVEFQADDSIVVVAVAPR